MAGKEPSSIGSQYLPLQRQVEDTHVCNIGGMGLIPIPTLPGSWDLTAQMMHRVEGEQSSWCFAGDWGQQLPMEPPVCGFSRIRLIRGTFLQGEMERTQQLP